MEKQKETRKELKRKLQITESDSFYALTNAYKNIDSCTTDNFMASGVTITIKNINKNNPIICEEFCIIDGLSEETIKAIKKDIKRSYDLKMSFIPKI